MDNAMTLHAYSSTGAMETWQATVGLRWNGAVLEQAWQCLNNGNVEWRSVRHVGPFDMRDAAKQEEPK